MLKSTQEHHYMVQVKKLKVLVNSLLAICSATFYPAEEWELFIPFSHLVSLESIQTITASRRIGTSDSALLQFFTSLV